MTMRFRVVLLAALMLCAGTAVAQTLKVATLAPDGSPWMKELRAAAKQVQEGTGGRVQVKYYPGGVMGNDSTVLKKIRLGCPARMAHACPTTKRLPSWPVWRGSKNSIRAIPGSPWPSK